MSIDVPKVAFPLDLPVLSISATSKCSMTEVAHRIVAICCPFIKQTRASSIMLSGTISPEMSPGDWYKDEAQSMRFARSSREFSSYHVNASVRFWYLADSSSVVIRCLTSYSADLRKPGTNHVFTLNSPSITANPTPVSSSPSPAAARSPFPPARQTAPRCTKAFGGPVYVPLFFP